MLCKKLAFLGAGRMMSAMMTGINRAHIQPAHAISAFDIDASKTEAAAASFGLRCCKTAAEAVMGADIVVIAVKPQDTGGLFSMLEQVPFSDTLFISIVAGCSTDTLSYGIASDQIVRSMPNIAATVQQSTTLYHTTKTTSSSHQAQAAQLFSAFGSSHQMQEERFLDMGTALTGSGPAYVLMLMEALVDSGVSLGFPRKVASLLVRHMMLGSVSYAATHASTHPAVLRSEITSPAGTTAAALREMNNRGFTAAIDAAVHAAYHRARELDQQS